MNVRREQKVNREHIYLIGTVCFLCALFAAYTYFVSASIVHVVIRKEATKEIAQLHSEISQLETQYINKQHSMSKEIASMQGFVTSNEKIFIDRTTDSLVLSSNGVR